MDKIYCSNCGNLVSPNANFCPYCGAPQHGPASAVYSAQAPTLVHTVAPTEMEIAMPSKNKKNKLQSEVIPRRHLAPRAIWLFFFNYIGRTFIVVPFFAIAIYLQPLFAVGLAAYLVVTFLIATLVYNNFFFSIDEHGFEKDYGIIHKTHVGLAFGQIQNVNITRSLIDRMLGIAKLDIETAGSSNMRKRDIVGGSRSKAEAHLPGLTLEDAVHLHDVLLQKAMHEQGTD